MGTPVTTLPLFECTAARWSPEIGDPTFMGWFTVAAYGVAGILCIVTGVRRRFPNEATFWVLLGVFMLLLMINKQLDLQSALTAFGRCVSQIQGWYDNRRIVQALFIVFFCFSGLVCLIWLTFVVWPFFSQVWLALFGVVFIGVFIAIRAAGFYHFDALINARLMGVRVNWILELGGIAMISANAVYRLLHRRKRRTKRYDATPS